MDTKRLITRVVLTVAAVGTIVADLAVPLAAVIALGATEPAPGKGAHRRGRTDASPAAEES